MTLEGQGPGEDRPTPPARTRPVADTAADDDVLLPPYVPGGRARGGRAPEPQEPQEDQEPEGPGGAGAALDSWDSEPTDEAASGTVEPEAAADIEASPYDFPWDDEGPGDAAGPATEEPAPVAEEDEFPFGAFDIDGSGAELDALPGLPAEPGPDEGLVDAAEEAETTGGAVAPAQPGGAPGPQALAARIEELAEVLRREGRVGLERELRSRDRLTSLVAGVVVGYLTGLEE